MQSRFSPGLTLSSPRTQATTVSRVALSPSLGRPAVMLPWPLLCATIELTVSTLKKWIEPLALSTGVIALTAYPARPAAGDSGVGTPSIAALKMVNVVVLGVDWTTQAPSYPAPGNAPVPKRLMLCPTIRPCAVAVVTVAVSRVPVVAPEPLPVVGWMIEPIT